MLHLRSKPGSFFTTSFKDLRSVCLWLCSFILFGFSNPDGSKEPPAKATTWVGTWGTAPQLVEPNNMPPAPGLENNTLRQVVCVSVGGKRLRLKFSNEFSKNPVTLQTIQIAVSKGGSTIDESTTVTVEFDGKPEFTMEPGAEVISDPVSFDLKPRMEVAITISFGQTSPTVTGHPGSRTTSYLLAGNQTMPNADFTNAAKTDHWYVIDGIEVEASGSANAAVAIIGDSITDGRGSDTNQQDRWPDILAINLQKERKTKHIGVLNMGIGGNCVLKGGLGPTALTRFDHDILRQNGVRWLIIFEGVNDLGSTRDSTAAFDVARDLIAAFAKMIDEAHARGIKVYGATITPFKKAGYYRPYRDEARKSINKWIRTSGHYDAVIDFDKTIRDPADPSTLLAEAQSDYLHPNELGYKMMGGAIDLSLFK
jgi:lysophospholipase L1-like esterase